MNFFSKKNIYTIAKLIIALTAYAYIYFKLKNFNFNYDFDSSKLYLLIISFLLLFDNWGFEALKWQFLIKKYEYISLIRAYKSVFSGVTSSVFTPNRVGEFVGRIFYISEGNKARAVLSTFVGSFSQFIISIVLGLFALFFSEPIIISEINFSTTWLKIPLLIISIALLVLYFKISVFSYLIDKFSFLTRFSDLFKSLKLYTSIDLLKILLLSLLRYFVFTVQFVLIVYFFDIDIAFYNIIIGLALFYLVLLIIPTISIAEPGVRSIIAIGVFSPYTNDANLFVFAIFLLWLINIVFPAVLGSVLLFFDRTEFTK